MLGLVMSQESENSGFQENGPVSSEAAAGGSSSNVLLWERPWTVEDMRKNANNWSLAGDAGLLNYLQEFSSKMIQQTHEMEQQVNGLVHEAKLTGVRLNNACNDFIMLANTQFVENRVYDEDVSGEDASQKEQQPDETEKTREQREQELIPKVTEAIMLGVNMIDQAFEKLDANVGYSDDSDDEGTTPYKADPILEAKDLYVHRALPHLIGTSAFMMEDDVGLVDAPSEDEAESTHGSLSETESEAESDREKKVRPAGESSSESETESESEGPEEEPASDESGDLFGTVDKKKKDIDDLYSEESEESETEKANGPKDFSSELANKLKSGPPKMDSSDEEEEAVKAQVKETKKSSKRKKSESKSKKTKPPEDDPFGPPMDDEEDSPFGKSGGLFSTSKSGLFDSDNEGGGGLFGDVEEKPKPAKHREKPVEADESEEETKPVKPKESKSSKKKSSKQATAGSDLFKDQDDDLFSSAKKSDVPQESKESKPAKTGGGEGGGGLFDDDEDDLFAEAAPKKAETSQQTKPAAKTVDLFGDNEADEDDLFAEVSKKPAAVTKEPEKEEEPIPQVKKEPPKKKLPQGAVSMFGGAPNPFMAIKKQQPDSDQEENDDWSDEESNKPIVAAAAPPVQVLPTATENLKPGGRKLENSPSPSSNSLFADEPEEDMFTGKAQPVKPAKKATSIFEDDDEPEDLFAVTSKPKQDDMKPASKTRAGSLFIDEEGEADLFATGGKTPPEKKKPVGGVALFGGKDLFGDSKKTPVEEKPQKEPEAAVKSPRKNTLSMFDDDDDDVSGDLFGEAQKKPGPTIEQKPRSKSRSLFDDEDVLFGGPEEESPKVDIFGSESPLKSSKEKEPSLAPDQADGGEKPNTNVTRKPVVSKKSLPASDLFGDDAEDDLFSSGITVKKAQPPKPAKQEEKLKVSGVTVDNSSSDPLGLTGTDDIFSPAVKPKAPSKKPAVEEKPKVSGVTTSESTTDPLGFDADEDFTSKPSKPEPSKPRKPVGGVSMFGGMDPASLLRSKASPGSSSSSDKSRESEPSIPSSPSLSISSQEPKPVISNPEAKKFDPLANRTPRPFGAGKLQSSLDINPAALLPGASPPVRVTEPTPVGFDEPAKVETLQSAAKDRAKIQTKRRPPSRAARQRAAQASADQVDFAAPAVTPARQPTVAPPVLNHVPPKETTKAKKTKKVETLKDIFDDSRVPPPLPSDDSILEDSLLNSSNNSTATSKKSSHTADIFGNDDLLDDSRVPPPLPSFPDVEEKDDIFASSSRPTVPKYDFDDLFSPSSPTKTSTPVVDDDVDDIFSDPTLKPKANPDSTKQQSVQKDVATTAPAEVATSGIGQAKNAYEEDDIFADSSIISRNEEKKPAAVAPAVEEDDIFADSVLDTQPSKAPPLSTEEEPSSKTVTKPKAKKPKKAVTKDEDLFADDTDIFADLPPAKPKEKKSKKKTAASKKSVFKDDVDDIFADTPSSKPKTKKSSKKPASTKNVLDDDAPSIFDDPLNALKS